MLAQSRPPPFLGRDCTNHTCRELILEIENIIECAIEAVGPQMRSRGSVDELTGDAQPAACLTHAAFEDVTNAQFAPDLPYVCRLALIGKAGVPSDDKETASAIVR